jgi:pyruvate/2-oxoglutarate dehydrogenase complex dihydrolipoamide dehydrogenase (E3) component
VLPPDDSNNHTLIDRVHPRDWRNPVAAPRYNLVVIGGGTAGLTSAVGAAGLGAKVAIIERHLMGGDCLNYGCVPSKALIRAARVAADARGGVAFGVHADAVRVDFGSTMARMRRLRAEISSNDSVARLTNLGIDVFLGDGRFSASDTIEVDGHTLRFARAIVATGSRSSVPSIPGLAEAGYLTNETVFSLTECPSRLVVIGGGPIGCELAQAFRRLGAEVTLVTDAPRLLLQDDPDAGLLIRATFEREGIQLVFNAAVRRLERDGASRSRRVTVEHEGQSRVLIADAVLLATGRAPNVEGIGLERAGIAFDRDGVKVNDRLRTTNARVWAAGDVTARFKFTHAADAMARICVQNALFFGRKAASALVMPWATFTDPEIAHVGLSSAEVARLSGVRTLTVQLENVDRAVLDGASEGFARVHADDRGRILGATIVAAHAGDLIGEMSLAIAAGVSLGTLAQTIHPYPTQAEAWKKLGDAWNRGRLTPHVRSLLDTFMRWRR